MGIRNYRKRSRRTAWHWCRRVGGAVFCLLFAGIVHAAPKTILILGDSLSAGYGIPNGSGWVALLDKRLKTDQPGVTVVNASISGDTTSGGRSRLPALLTRHKPAVVIIELGGNDGLRGLPVATIDANLRAMIVAAKAAKAKVLLLGIRLPSNYGSAYGDAFAALYGKVAQQTKTPLVPFMLEGIGDKPHLFQSDGIHPTVDAQPVILSNVWPKLNTVLK